MKKYVIAIEETVVQEFAIWANDDNQAIEKAQEKYKAGDFILEPGECQRRKMAIVAPNTGLREWYEF